MAGDSHTEFEFRGKNEEMDWYLYIEKENFQLLNKKNSVLMTSMVPDTTKVFCAI